MDEKYGTEVDQSAHEANARAGLAVAKKDRPEAKEEADLEARKFDKVKGKGFKSWVWTHFKKHEQKSEAMCDYCGKILKHESGLAPLRSTYHTYSRTHTHAHIHTQHNYTHTAAAGA